MKPDHDKGTIKSQSSSRGRKTTRLKLDHGPSERDEELSTLAKETVRQKRLKQNKSESKSSRNARDRAPLALESEAKVGVIKIETTTENAEEAKLENIKKRSLRLRKKVDTNVKKRKIEDQVEAKRKTLKKDAAKTDIIIEKHEQVDSTDENGMTHTRKRVNRNLKKQTEALEIPDIPAKRKRKRSLVADVATKKLKFNTEKRGKKLKKEGVAEEGVAEEGVAGEVNSDTEDKMAKQVATKAVKFVGAHMSAAGMYKVQFLISMVKIHTA